MTKRPIPVFVYEDDPEFPQVFEDAKESAAARSDRVQCISHTVVKDRHGFDKLVSTEILEQSFLALVDISIDGDPMEGIRAIAELRARDDCSELPIIVFSSSGDKRTRESAYKAGATSYVKKPARDAKRAEALGEILSYWLDRHCLINVPKPAA